MPYPVTVIRSKRRKRSVSARIVDGAMELTVPSWMSRREESEFIDKMQKRFDRKSARSSVDLTQRCCDLAKRYDLPTPASVRWVTNQTTRWGSCTSVDASIRLSNRMQHMPQWVIDAVLVHELAHLVHPDHSPAFYALANRFERQDEATGFLDGVVWSQNHTGTGVKLSGEELSEEEPIEAESTEAESTETGEPGLVGPVELEGLDLSFNATQLGFDFVEQLGSKGELGRA